MQKYRNLAVTLIYFLLCCDTLQVDAGHIYGDNLERQLQLRLHKDGKLKYQVKQSEDRENM